MMVQALLDVLGSEAKQVALLSDETSALGNTPLQSVIQHGTEAKIQSLINTLGSEEEARQVITLSNSYGWTLFHVAVRYGTKIAIEALIKVLGPEQASQGAALPTHEGNTALHLATLADDKTRVHTVIQLLGSKACQVALVANLSGLTPLHLAFGSLYAETIYPIIEVLGIKYSAVLNSQGNFTNLSPHEKQQIEKAIPFVIERYLHRLVKGEALTDNQRALCVQQEEILKTKLLKLYSDNEAVLERATKSNDPLGSIFWPRLFSTIFSLKTPKKVIEIQARLTYLQKTKADARKIFEDEFNNEFDL